MPNGEETIDDKADAAEETPKPETPQARGGSIFDSIGSSIDDLVKTVREIPKAAKEAAYYTYYTAKAAVGCAAGFAMGGFPTLIFPVGVAIGTAITMWRSKEKIKFRDAYKRIANEVGIAGVLAGFINYYFAGANHLANTIQSAYGAPAGVATRVRSLVPYVSSLLATHELLNRALVSDYEPKPLKDIPKKIIGPMKWLLPIMLTNFAVVPYYFQKARATVQMSLVAANSILYGFLRSEKKPEGTDYNKLAQAPQQQTYGAPKPT